MELPVPGQVLCLKHRLPVLLSFMGSERCCHQVLGGPVGPGPWAAHEAGLCLAQVWLSPLFCRELQAGNSEQQAAQEGTHHRIGRDQLEQEPFPGLQRAKGRAGDRRKSHGTVAMSGLQLPAKEDTLPVCRPVRPAAAK